MAEATPRGSILLKLLIIILAAVVIAAIVVPQKTWKQQTQDEIKCRQNMENIFYTSLQYLMKTTRFESSLDTLIEFTERDSMVAYPGTFLLERLTVWESPRDSFLVEFNDRFRYDRIDWEYIAPDPDNPGNTSPDSVYLYLVPKERFEKAPKSRYLFHSDDSIFVERREKGEDDISVLVYGKSQIPNQWVPDDTVIVLVKDFAVSEDPDVFAKCPSCGKPYHLSANVRLKLKGDIKFTVLRREEGNVADNEFLRLQFLNRVRSDAMVAAVNAINADTSIFIAAEDTAEALLFGQTLADTVEITVEDSAKVAAVCDSIITALRDSMTTENLHNILKMMKTKATLTLEEETLKVLDADSTESWNDLERIKNLLFQTQSGEKVAQLEAEETVQTLLKRLKAEEHYYIANVDTVGLTIACPIDLVYESTDKGFLEKLFGVGPVENHGRIFNGDYSWSEKK